MIRIGDRVVNEISARDPDIAMVFQNYALHPQMSVDKNLAFGLRQQRFCPGFQAFAQWFLYDRAAAVVAT